MNTQNKISIVGNSSAGKSTLARKIGKASGIDVFTIDKIYWLPGWILREQRAFNALHDAWLSQPRWIIDGVGYWEQLVQRIAVSDFVIYYDVPVSVCKRRAAQRIAAERYAPNPNITAGCFYRDVRERQMEVIETFDAEMKPKILKLLAGLDPAKYIVITQEEFDFLFKSKRKVY